MVTVRQWLPLVSFVLYWRDAALTAIEHFERAQKHALGLHTFGRLGAVSDPAYLEELLAVMQQKIQKKGTYDVPHEPEDQDSSRATRTTGSSPPP